MPSKRPSGAAWLSLLLAFLAAPQARAWSCPTHESVAEQAARLMPASLRLILAENRQRLLQGACAPLAGAGQPQYELHPDGSGGLDAAVQAQSQVVLDLLGQRAPFSMVAYELGVLSHLVARAEEPANSSADDPLERDWSPDFEAFVDQRRPKLRVVFDGYLSAPLERDDVRGFVRETCERSRRHYAVLAESYRLPDGRIARGATFDERHPVHGVATLAYAHSIGDTAKLWLYLWIRSNGDTTGLPLPQALQATATVQVSGQ